MPDYRIDTIIDKLEQNTDLQNVLTDARLSASKILRLFKTRRGKFQLEARRQLAQIHSQLVAHRFCTFAVSKLCEITEKEKPELRLKAALALLSVAGCEPHDRQLPPGEESDAASQPWPLETRESTELMAAVVHVLRQFRTAPAKPRKGKNK